MVCSTVHRRRKQHLKKQVGLHCEKGMFALAPFPNRVCLLAICVHDTQTGNIHNTETVTSFKNIVLLPLFCKDFPCVNKTALLLHYTSAIQCG